MTRTLGEIATWYSGGTPKAGTPRFYGGDIAWAVIADLPDGMVTETATTITDAGLSEIGGRVAPVGAVMVSMYGTIGRVGLVGRPMATNQAIAWAVVDRGVVIPEFLMIWLGHNRPALDALGRGATQRNINREIIRGFRISVPPLAAQRRIVSLLEAVDLATSAAARTTEAATSCLSAVLEGELDGVRSRLRLRDISEPRGLIGGPFGSDLRTRDYTDDGIPVINGVNHSKAQLELAGPWQYVSEAKASALNRNLARPGDVVATNQGSVGQVSLVPYGPDASYLVSQRQLRLRVDQRQAMPEFVVLALRSHRAQADLASQTIRTGVTHINLRIFGDLQIPMPDLTIQQRIVRLAEGITRVARGAFDEKRRLMNTRSALMHALLSGEHSIPAGYDHFLDGAA